MKELSFRLDDLSGADVQDLLRRHLDTMAEHSPPESRHALDLSGLKELSPDHGEIKSMHIAKAAFAPAHALYSKYGFTDCPPFANYRLDPNSTFMTRTL